MGLVVGGRLTKERCLAITRRLEGKIRGTNKRWVNRVEVDRSLGQARFNLLHSYRNRDAAPQHVVQDAGNALDVIMGLFVDNHGFWQCCFT
jgi:hypothetical protein